MTTSVRVGNNFFNPEDILVASGATVTWTWDGGVPHNVTFAANPQLTSSTQTSGQHQATMPAQAGRYDYQCTIHPATMNGSVTVQ